MKAWLNKGTGWAFATALTLALAAGPTGTFAQEQKNASTEQGLIDYPVDTVTLITHGSPGGGSDVFLREISRFLKDIVDTNFVVENVVGGSGAQAISRLAQGPNDGSLIYAAVPTYIFTSLLSKLEYGWDDTDALTNFFIDPQVLYTSSDSGFKTLQDVLDAAKEGRGVWGAPSPGSMERIVLEQLKKQTGVNATVVPTAGGGDTLINVLNGTFDVAVGEILEMQGQIASGKITMLASFTEERLERYPDLPTAKESGVDLVVSKFRGLASPPNLPKDVIAKWEEITKRLLEHPEYQKLYKEANLVPAYMGQEEYAKFLDDFATDTQEFLSAVGLIQK